jgi:thiosulfate/3-mercaptopyruvate sulfurtransferase
VLHADQTLRPAHEVRAVLTAAGVDGSRPVVTSCGTGVTAAVLTLAMAASNMPIGALYDGAWTEWGGRPDTPVEVTKDA